MIQAKFFRNTNGDFYAFEIKNHGRPVICSAVSALSINAINSIETFSPDGFNINYEVEGGYIYFELDDNKDISSDSLLLLNSLHLGLSAIRQQYKNSISILEEVLEC